MAEYAGVLLFPWRLHMERDVETHPNGFGSGEHERGLLAGVADPSRSLAHGGGAFALWRSRRRPAIFLPLLLAIVCYLPISGVIALNATVAEHWLYLPSAFLFLGAAAALESSGWIVAKNFSFADGDGLPDDLGAFPARAHIPAHL